MTLKIRPAHAGDLARLTDILHRSKGSHGYSAEKMENFRANFRITARDLTRPVLLVAEREGALCGFAGALREKDRLAVDYLFIAPEAQGQGIGRLLLRRLEDMARCLDIHRLSLSSDHFAVSFYEREGFRVVDHCPSPMSPTGTIPKMEKDLAPAAFPIAEVRLTMHGTREWGFEQNNSSGISAHWLQARRANPHLWNGRTLKVCNLTVRDGVIEGLCQEGSFASYLAWRDWGYPGLTDYNLFGSAVVRSRDGALLFGVMADHTANPGKIYPPGGSLEPSDVDAATGRVDVFRSTYRELEEETGLSRAEVREGSRLAVIFGQLVSIAVIMEVAESAAALKRRILDHSMNSEEKELKDILILRGEEDLGAPGLQPWAREIARAVFALSPAPLGEPLTAG